MNLFINKLRSGLAVNKFINFALKLVNKCFAANIID